MEQAYAQLRTDKDGKIGMYCVGSTVIHYYLDDYIKSEFVEVFQPRFSYSKFTQSK